LIALTFLPLDGLNSTHPPELRLQAFRTINFAFRKGFASQQFLVLIGNIAAFIPLGILFRSPSTSRSQARPCRSLAWPR